MKRKFFIIIAFVAALMVALPTATMAQVTLTDGTDGSWGNLNEDPTYSGTGSWGSFNAVDPYTPVGDGIALLIIAGVGYAAVKHKNNKKKI